MTENKPKVDHLDVGGGGKALHLADEDGGHHQHGGQVHAQGGLKEEGLEEGGGEGDGKEKEGGEVGRHQLADKLSLQDNRHPQPILVSVVLQIPRRDLKDVHV